MLENINKNDNIGRYFNQHPRGTIGVVEASRSEALALQGTFNNFLRPRRVPVQYEVGLALSEVAQRKYQLLNASVGLYYEVDDSTIWKSGKRIENAIKKPQIYSGILRDCFVLIIGIPLVCSNIIRRYILGREIIHNKPTIIAVIDLEQQPMRESRIYLSNDTDKLGMRKAIVDWRITEKERETARQFAEFLGDELRQNHLGKLKKSAWLTQTSPLTDEDLSGNLHFIGATRMAANDQFGVVDKDCRVFGSENLYVSGASIFPTGGHANPMLTIVALAIRLADHLKLSLDNGSSYDDVDRIRRS